MHDNLRGIFAPIATPFEAATGDVNHGALARNVALLMQTGLTGLLALGSNGEAALLDEDESDAVLATVREVVPSGRLLLAGTGRESTRATQQATARAANLGADAVLVRAPSFFKTQMTADALVRHYTAVADSSPVPVLLYNLPAVTGVPLTVPVVRRLADHPNIVGIKETSPDLDRLGEFVTLGQQPLRVFCGWAPVAYPAIVSGASGAILAVANVLPDACVSLFELSVAGRHAEALELQRRLTPIAQLVGPVYGIAGLKVALDLAGYEGGYPRGPLGPLTKAQSEEVAAALAAVRQLTHVPGR